MAIQSVSDPIRDPGPAAFTCHDSSVFIGWIQAMGEMAMHTNASRGIEGHVVANYGGLILALAEAAEELADKERAEWVKAKAA